MGILSARLGLADNVRDINVVAYCTSASASIAILVFVQGSTNALIHARLGGTSVRHYGQILGNLVLVDEVVAIAASVVWGALANRYGVRIVSSIGHILTAAMLVAFASCQHEWELYLARAGLSVGASALTCMLAAVLASMTAMPPRAHPDAAATPPTDGVSESAPLLPRPPQPGGERKSARLAGIVSFAGGIGALLSAFGLLRLPLLSPGHLDSGVIRSFWITSALPLCVGIALLFALMRRGEKFLAWIRRAPGAQRPRLCWLRGFKLAQRPDVAIALSASFAARAISNTTVLFIPGLVNASFPECHLGSEGQSGPDCRRALALASALTGTVQLSALLAAPIVGFLASVVDQELLLALSLIVGGTGGFLTIGLLSTARSGWTWPACILAGCAQSGSVVTSLAMCARARVRILSSASDSGPGEKEDEVAGAIAGAYASAGAMGILIVGFVQGYASDLDPRWPFRITALVCVLSILVPCILHRTRTR